MGPRLWRPLQNYPKRIQIAVWDDSCHSQIKGFWIPAFAGMTVMQRSPFARTRGGIRFGVIRYFLWWKRMVFSSEDVWLGVVMGLVWELTACRGSSKEFLGGFIRVLKLVS